MKPILRVFQKDDGGVVVTVDPQAFSDPGEWGVVLADVVRDLAKSMDAPLAELKHGERLTEPQRKAAARLLELFHAELQEEGLG